eukprot:6349612-Prymnesium_polylepis.1
MGQIDEKVSAWRAAASAHARDTLTQLMEARVAVQEAAQPGDSAGGGRPGERLRGLHTGVGERVCISVRGMLLSCPDTVRMYPCPDTIR